jgi:hypothetical protein
MFPDQSTFLNTALDYYLRKGASEDVYRLFMAAPGFNADINDPSTRRRLLRPCPNSRCFNVIMAHQDPEFFGRSTTARFDPAAKLERMPFSGVREILGRTDRELAHLRCSNNGWTSLHCVAYRLRGLPPYPSALIGHRSVFEERLDFGACLLQNGADPCGILPIDVSGQDSCQLTPLLVLLEADHWLPRANCISTWERAIGTWINMLQLAAVDLLQYWASSSMGLKRARPGSRLLGNPMWQDRERLLKRRDCR